MKRVAAISLSLFFWASVAHAAIIGCAGFETGDTSEFQSSAGTNSVVTSPVHTGVYAGRINPTTTGTGNFRFGFTSAATGLNNASFNVATMYTRFYLRIATAPAANDEEFVTVLDTAGTSKIFLRLDSGRHIVAYDTTNVVGSTGTTVLNLNQQYRINLKTSTAAVASAYEVLIDGTTELSGTILADNTNNGSIRFGKTTNRNGQTVDFYYDDICVSDSAEPGPGAGVRLAPTANGTTHQWTSGTNASDWNEVKEVPTDNDTTYVMSTGVAGDINLVTFASATTAGVTSSINDARIYGRIRESVDVTTSTRIQMKSSATTLQNSTGIDPTTTYSNRFVFSATDPATSAAWTLSGLNSLQGGVKEENAVSTRCTTNSLLVDYDPTVVTSGRLIGQNNIYGGVQKLNGGVQ